MSNQFGGITLSPKLGANFYDQYNVRPDANMTNQTTIANDPHYDNSRVNLGEPQPENVYAFNKNSIFLVNGLKAVPEVENSTFTAIG